MRNPMKRYLVEKIEKDDCIILIFGLVGVPIEQYAQAEIIYREGK